MIEQHDDSVTIAGAPMLAATYRAALAGIARRRHDGLPAADLQALARALRRAHDDAMSRERHEIAAAVNTSACWDDQSACDWCDVAEAANILQLSRRQVQRMARAPGGLVEAIQVGRIWLLRRAPLLVQAAERKAK